MAVPLKHLLILAAALSIGGGTARAGFIVDLGTFSVDPRSSYLRASSVDSPDAPLFINLASLAVPVLPGSAITINTVGDYCAMGGFFCTQSPQPLGAVFSSLGPGSLQATNVVNRLPGAVATPGAGGVIDPNAWYGNLPADIPQDFLVPFGPIDVTVPQGAAWLVIGTLDSYYADNTDPDHNLGIHILTDPPDPPIPASNPEPGTQALLAAGLGGLAVWHRIRSRR